MKHHDRIRSLIKRAGGLTKEELRCPKCGGKLRISDDRALGQPLCALRYRYDLGCKDNDCVSVCGPSVGWCVRQWKREVAEAKQAA